MAQIVVKLKPSERNALRQLAERERRDPRQQAALIIRRELESVGLLPTQTTPTPTDTAKAAS